MRQTARMREMRNAYKISVGNPEKKRPHARQRRRGEGSIWINFRKMKQEDADWMHLAQDKEKWGDDVNTVMNPRVT